MKRGEEGIWGREGEVKGEEEIWGRDGEVKVKGGERGDREEGKRLMGRGRR